MQQRDQAGSQKVRERILEHEDHLSRTERRVAEYFAMNGPDTVFLSAVELAKRTKTSDATVIRTAKALGFTGLPELKLELGSELMNAAHPVRRLVTKLNLERTELLEAAVSEAFDRIHETQRLFEQVEFDEAVEVLRRAEMVMTFGVGVSRTVAEYAAIRLGRLGKRVRYAGSMGFALADDLLQLREGDAVVVFNPGRFLPEMEATVEHCRALGVKTVHVSGAIPDPANPEMDIVLQAALSPGGLTGETLSESLVVDLLVLALGQELQEDAARLSERLGSLRRQLVPKFR